MERSPHAKESYDAAEFEALVEKYEKLNWRIIRCGGGGRETAGVCSTGGRGRLAMAAAAAPHRSLPTSTYSKPGGATVKPDDFYTLYGSVLASPLPAPGVAAALCPTASLPVPWPCHLRPCLRGLCSYHQQASAGDNSSERPMWAEKGGLDFEGRARWDAWTAVKARGAGPGDRPSKGRCALRACARTVARLPASLPTPHPAHPGPNMHGLQGMAADKAKLAFVRAYYEFSPKALYTDTRGAAAAAP